MVMRAGILPGLFLVLMCAPALRADDASDLRAAVSAYYEATNSGDFERVNAFLLPGGFSEFASTGGPRVDISPATLKGYFDRGLKVDLHVRDVRVELFGEAAYATYIRTGTLDPDGKGDAKPRTLRTTSVWVRREGHWYIVHIHNSPLVEPPKT